ncbi:hypothetical protein SB6420_02721 [Klebsiella pasteurii]|nr:hypothetical protein SB6420_02721 [Klebsiella pasteurii]
MPADAILRVQNALVTQTGEIRPGLCTFSITCCQEGFRIMVRFPGGDPFLTENTFGAVLRFQRFAVVVVPGGDTSAHHIVCSLNIPDTLLPAVAHPGLVAQWQGDTELILLLAVLENHHVLLKTAVHFIAPVDTHLRQQALDKLKVSFPPLGDELPGWIFPGEPELKIGSFQPVFT